MLFFFCFFYVRKNWRTQYAEIGVRVSVNGDDAIAHEPWPSAWSFELTWHYQAGPASDAMLLLWVPWTAWVESTTNNLRTPEGREFLQSPSSMTWEYYLHGLRILFAWPENTICMAWEYYLQHGLRILVANLGRNSVCFFFGFHDTDWKSVEAPLEFRPWCICELNLRGLPYFQRNRLTATVAMLLLTTWHTSLRTHQKTTINAW
jgi:hypothetical protein